jgi:hypothetical protein
MNVFVHIIRTLSILTTEDSQTLVADPVPFY